MVDISDIEKAIDASEKFQALMSGILPPIFMGVESFTENSNNPDALLMKSNALHVLNGSMIVYLFSMWDALLGNSYVEKYFRQEEKVRFYAFKHIRIVAAHNIDGNRKGNRADRMDHADKLDEVMGSDQAISGLILEEYKIDLSQSHAALDCRQFMQNMAMLLAAGRIFVGGPHGQIKVVGGNGGTTEVM